MNSAPRQILLVSLLLLVAAPALAAEWHRAEPEPALANSPQQAARLYLSRHSGDLGLDGVELSYGGTLSGPYGQTVRFTQRRGDLPVLYTAVVVRLGKDGTVRHVVTDVRRDLAPLELQPSLTPEDAVAALEARGYPVAVGARTELAVLPSAAAPHLVWHLPSPSLEGGRRYLVDAHDGSILGAAPLAMDALGRVYPINPIVTPELQDLELPLLDVVDP